MIFHNKIINVLCALHSTLCLPFFLINTHTHTSIQKPETHGHSSNLINEPYLSTNCFLYTEQYEMHIVHIDIMGFKINVY